MANTLGTLGENLQDPVKKRIGGVKQVGSEVEKGFGQVKDILGGGPAPKMRQVDPNIDAQIAQTDGQVRGLAAEAAHKQQQAWAQPITPLTQSGLQTGLQAQQGTLTGQMLGNALGQGPLNQQLLSGALGQGALNEQMLARALGQVPSVAQMAIDRAVGQSVAGQQSVIGGQRSARGGLANIARQRAGESGQRAIAEEGGIAAASELAQAEQAALQGQLQQQQLGLQGQVQQQQLAAQNLQAQQQQENQRVLQNQQLEQQMVEAKRQYDDSQRDFRLAAINGNIALKLQAEKMKQQAYNTYEEAKAARSARQGQLLGSILGAAGTVAGGMLGGPAGAAAGGMLGKTAGAAVG